MLDLLDPQREIITTRLYRENCTVTPEGVYIKDLRIFNGVDLKDILIVDNAAYSFGFHIDNGVPIVPYYDDCEDEELKHLISYL